MADDVAIAPPGSPAGNGSVLGQPIDRVDGMLKTTGTATYAHEYRVSGDLAYGVLATATIGKGRITALDTAAAEQSPGVILVMSHRNAPPQAPFGPPVVEDRHARPKPQFATSEVRHFGEPVALVVAASLQQAEAAAALVRVSYADEPGTWDLAGARAEAQLPSRMVGKAKPDSAIGDIDTAFAEAPVKIDQTYTTPYQNHSQIEPHAATATWDGELLTVYCAAQIVADAHKSIATTLQLAEDKVRVISRYIGGGFGGKLPIYADAICAALAARALGRPVKVALSRVQMFSVTTHRPASHQRVRLAAREDGTLLAIGHEALTQSTPFDEFVEPVATCTRSLYAAPVRLTRHRIKPLDLPVADAMRAPGEAIGLLALEQAVDELAVRLAMDPLELRLRNESAEDPERKVPFSTRALVPCLERGAELFGWSRRNPQPGAIRDGRWLVGMGMAAAIRPNYLQPAKANLRLEPDGRARARLDMTDIGTGTYTILTQIVADGLALAPGDVVIELGDSHFPVTPGSGGSFGAASSGAALHQACLALRDRLASLAMGDAQSPLSGARRNDLTFRDGQIVAGGQAESYVALLRRNAPRGVEADGRAEPGRAYEEFSQHCYGAHFAEVGVDIYSGEVRVRRMVGVFAAGRLLNPKTVRSQLIGGMVWGIGSALHEENVVDLRTGAFVNRDLVAYHVPVHADVPAIEVEMLPEFDPHANALGSKGVGELGICGAGAAVANAVFNACGARIRDYPLTPDKILPFLPATPIL